MLKKIWILITKNKAISFVVLIAIIVIGLYFLNFHHSFSDDNGKWGTFGDYIGGILNPIVAAFALYLIAKTYDLQKKELEETRKQLEISTDAQKKQVELAALTALLNSKLMQRGGFENLALYAHDKIDRLESENKDDDAQMWAKHSKENITSKIEILSSEIEKLENKINAIGNFDK